ncbi:MAG: peptidoglycan-associated lipoprotein Pal [Candidatus Binataceae bacterium]
MNSANWSRLLIAAAMLSLITGGAGCSSKNKPLEGLGAGGGSQLGEQGLGANKTSLEQFQKGTLGTSSGGPLTDVHFDYDEYTIRPQDGEVLRANASWLREHAENRVQVEGHCDERGSEEYNIALGAKRAQAAKDYLVTLGVTPARVSTISYGKELQLCSESTESCWAQNRRAHFVTLQ